MKKDFLLVDKHMMVVGPTGSGKTTKVIIPYLLSAINQGESIVVTDGKDKILNKVYRQLVEKEYKIVTINLKNVENSHGWNPLALPYRYYLAGEMDICLDLLNDLGSNIMASKTQGDNGDPFWIQSAKNMFVGLALSLFEDCEEWKEMVNLRSIFYMSVKGFERMGNSTYIHAYFKDKHVDSIAAMNMSPVLSAPNDTRNSIISVFNEKLLTFISKSSFWNKLCFDEIDFEQICDQRAAIFLIFEDEKIEPPVLINVFIRQLYELYVKKYAEIESYNPPKCRFVLDDFTSLVPFNNLQNMLTSARERNIFLLFSVNSVTLLEKNYGEHITEFLLNNCRRWIVFSNTELKFIKMLTEIVKVLCKKDMDYMNCWKEGTAFVFDDAKELTVMEFFVPELVPMDYFRERGKSLEKCEIFKIDEFIRNKLKLDMNKRIGQSGDSSKFDIDELISKIDKKIAELEKEEKESGKVEVPDTDSRSILAPVNEGQFRVYDEHGREVMMNALFTFDNQETGKHYIVYSDGTVEDGSTKVYASILDMDEKGRQRLIPIKSDREYKVVETILEQIQNSIHDKLEEKNT